MKKIIIVLVGLFSCVFSFSQVVNIEQARIRMDSIGWAGMLNGNFSAQKYQDVFYNAALRGTVQHKMERELWLLLLDAGISVADQVQLNNNSLIHVRNNYDLYSWVRWETFAQIQQNRLLGLRRRHLIGSGPRFIIWDDDRFRLFAGTLAMLEIERVRNTTKSDWYGRASTYISWSVNKPGKWAFSSTTYFQPIMNRLNDHRWAGQHAFSVALNRNWSMRLELTHFYDSKPPVDIVKSTFNTFIGITYDVDG